MDITGKIISFLGDSITEGFCVNNCSENRYDNIIKREAKAEAVHNYGIGGTRIAYQHKATVNEPVCDLYFSGRVKLIEPKSDIVIVFGGTNDYGHGDAPLGNFDDTTPDTFCGAVEHLINTLDTMLPMAKIIFLTPMRRLGDESGSNDPNKGEAFEAKPLWEYVNIIEKKAKAHNIPVLNLYNELTINPNDEYDRTTYTADGLHLNDEGHKMLADCVLKFIEAL